MNQSSKSERQRERYQALKAQVKCPECMRHNDNPTHVVCLACRLGRQENERRLINEGTCVRCKAPCGGSNRTCEACSRKNREYSKSRYKMRRKNKICVRCKRPVESGNAHCEDCRTDYSSKRKLTQDFAKRVASQIKNHAEIPDVQSDLMPPRLNRDVLLLLTESQPCVNDVPLLNELGMIFNTRGVTTAEQVAEVIEREAEIPPYMYDPYNLRQILEILPQHINTPMFKSYMNSQKTASQNC